MKIVKVTKRTRTELCDTHELGQSVHYGITYRNGVDCGTRIAFTHLGSAKPTYEVEMTIEETKKLHEYLTKRINDHEILLKKQFAEAGLPWAEF